jgi:hypothetical protein
MSQNVDILERATRHLMETGEPDWEPVGASRALERNGAIQLEDPLRRLD